MADQEAITSAVLEDPVVKAVLASDGKRTSDKNTIVTAEGKVTATPTSTEEEDRVSEGQRRVNLLWENTQRQIALLVIGSALVVASVVAIFGKYIGSTEMQLAAVVFLFGVANLVTGFYFGRTNHQRIGGVVQGR